MALKVGVASRLSAGPFTGVWENNEPFGAETDKLTRLINGYIPTNPSNGASAYGRPGFLLRNGGDPIFTSVPAFRCQAIYSHQMLDGSPINFIVYGGRLFRADGTYDTYADVTPAGVTIDPGISTRVFCASLIGMLFVTDGVNRPWLADNLTSTPITGQYVDYDGHGVSWTIYGQPVVYNGAIFGILNQANGISRRADVSWCNPGTPLIGWQQDDFDNNWTLTQRDAGPLWALYPTNAAVYYFRERSIGYFAGTVGPDLASTATQDSVAFDVGTLTPQLIQGFGNSIYFGDANGRPQLFQPGQAPTDIWKQMQTVVANSTAGYPSTTQLVSSSALETNLNLYCAAIWSPSPGIQAPPIEMVIYNAQNSQYNGRWSIRDGVSIDCMGNFVDSTGRSTMMVAGSAVAGGANGYLWSFSGFSAIADHLTTTDGRRITTTDGRELTTVGIPPNWQDNATVPVIQATTDRLGYDEDFLLNADLGTVILLSPTTTQVSLATTTSVSVVEGTPSPVPSQDGTYRLPVGFDLQGRGMTMTVQPTTADTQFVLSKLSIRVIPSLASPEDG